MYGLVRCYFRWSQTAEGLSDVHLEAHVTAYGQVTVTIAAAFARILSMGRARGGKRDIVTPAQGDLRILQAFANTVDVEAKTDDLSRPSVLADWLSSRGLFDPATEDLGPQELERALDLRAALRRLLLGNVGAKVDEATFQALDGAAAGAQFRLRVTREGARYEIQSKSFGDALGRIVEMVATAQQEGHFRRLKLCASGECRTAFFDASKGATQKWCLPKCGVKLRVQAYRRTEKYRALR